VSNAAYSYKAERGSFDENMRDLFSLNVVLRLSILSNIIPLHTKALLRIRKSSLDFVVVDQ
jgi:hypothetical protein